MRARILVVDDSPAIRNQIRLVLERALEGAVIVEAGDGLQAFKVLGETQPDLVICDLVMPTFDGLKFLTLRATRPDLCNVPVLMLTAEGDLERKVEMLDRGASDYVTKPFNDKELIARVRVHYRLKLLQDELREANQRLESLSSTDSLTGVYNRRHFDKVLLEESRRMLRYKTPVSVILADVDFFKRVNDEHGHAMGDEVLINIGRALAGAVRNVDTLARYGGEEFAVILPQTPVSGAAQLAERLRQRVTELSHGQNLKLRTSASFGVAGYDGSGPAPSGDELTRRADEALYAAKRAGRNRVVCWPVQ